MTDLTKLLKNPVFVLAVIFGSANMGIYTSFSFYYFQNFLLHDILDFLIIYSGIGLASLIGLVFGFNIANRFVRIFLFFSCFIQIISFPMIYYFFITNNHVIIVINLAISGFFEASIGLYLIPKANRVKNYDHRLRQNTILWGTLYLGMAIFSLLFIYNIALSFLFGFCTTIIGSFGLYLLVREDRVHFENFKRIPIKEIFRADYLSYLILFFIYFGFFFSMVSIISFSDTFINMFPTNSLVILLIPLLVVNAVLPLTLWYKLNRRFSLKSIFNLTYIVSSASIIFIFYNSGSLLIAYSLELWTWSIFSIYIFVNIGDAYPGLTNIQPINFWWFTLAMSVGLGVLFPLLIPSRTVLFATMLIIILVSIALFSYLKTFKRPSRVFYLMIQTKNGHKMLERTFSDPNFNTELFSGVFGAMNVLFKESFGSDKNLRSIEYENKNVLLVVTENLYTLLVTDRYDSTLRRALIEISNLVEVSYYNRILKYLATDINEIDIQLDSEKLPEVLKQKISNLDYVHI